MWELCLTHIPMCHIYVSGNWVRICSDNGLLPIRCKPTLAVSAVIEHIEVDKSLDMVDKTGIGKKNE